MQFDLRNFLLNAKVPYTAQFSADFSAEDFGGSSVSAPVSCVFTATPTMEGATLTLQVQAVANAQGIPLNDQDLRNWVQLVDQLDPQAMPSMAQDMVSGRKSELELFSGTVVPIARKLSIDVPVLTSLLEKITAMEQEL